jgi:zinc protease
MARRPSLALAALAAVSALPASAQVGDWKDIRKPELRRFQPQQPRRIVLPNGLVVFLQEDHELPLVQGTLRIRGGSRDEEAGKVGLASIYGQAWRTGGTRTRTGDQLDDYLEARAARVETGGGHDSTTVSFNCLTENFDEVFAAFLELLQEPEFRPEKIELAKNQINTGIARRNDSPQAILFRESAKIAYGADSPYGRHPEYATAAAVTRDDLLGWHRTYVHPNNMVLGVVGDFDARALEGTLRRTLGALRRGPAARKVDARFPGPRPGYYFVQKDDTNQSSIRLVHLGTTMDDPEYYALAVMNEVFGGGFAARLFTNVRSRKGLAYAVGGGVGTPYDYPGLFSIFTSTKSGTTAAAIDALYEEIDNLHETPATPDELQRAKEAILNSFVFRLDSKAKVLFEKVTYEFYGYPLDFAERFRAGIEKVTAADVARVARKYVDKDKLAVLVVGKASDFDRPLTSFGEVTTLDVAIPEAGGSRR